MSKVLGKAIMSICYLSFLVTPHRNCRLKLLKMERIKDYLLMEEEFIQNQERLKPQEEKQEVSVFNLVQRQKVNERTEISI